jgi:K+/H+ antiporter YhaU regulatory subunit KhtT
VENDLGINRTIDGNSRQNKSTSIIIATKGQIIILAFETSIPATLQQM